VGNLDVELWDAARRAFTQANDKRIAIREIGLMAYHFLQADVQLDLWDDPSTAPDAPAPGTIRDQREEELQHAIDQITTRWGARGVRVGVGSEG
jgi:hypothetical protein